MKLIEKYQNEVNEFVNVCKRLADNNFVTGYGGNLAWKLDDDLLLITPTQMNKGDITAQDVVFINKKGETIEGGKRPTGETPMYVKFFNERSDIVTVIHCHAPHVCAFAIMKNHNWLMRPYYPETVTEVGPVPVVPYGQPLTQLLADNFSPYLQKYNSFLMENHGLVTMSRDSIKWTMMNVELLEASAQSLLAAISAGEVQELTRQAVVELGNVMRTRSLPLFGAPGVNQSLEDMYF